jgi:hypothetical protein
VFALEKFAAAKMIERAMLGGGHQPCARIVRYGGARPLFERGEQSVLRKFFGQANIANDTRKRSNNSCGLDAPHSVNGAMGGGSSFDLDCHGDPFHW